MVGADLELSRAEAESQSIFRDLGFDCVSAKFCASAAYPSSADRGPLRDAMGAIRGVGQHKVVGNAQQFVERGGDVVRTGGQILDERGVAIGGADDLSAANAAAGPEHRVGVAPVVAAAIALLLIFGVRPISPMTMTSVS